MKRRTTFFLFFLRVHVFPVRQLRFDFKAGEDAKKLKAYGVFRVFPTDVGITCEVRQGCGMKAVARVVERGVKAVWPTGLVWCWVCRSQPTVDLLQVVGWNPSSGSFKSYGLSDIVRQLCCS